MVKINKDILDKIIGTAALRANTNANTNANDMQPNVSVYNVPRAWLESLKRNKISISAYFKQAIRDKLIRDGFISE